MSVEKQGPTAEQIAAEKLRVKREIDKQVLSDLNDFYKKHGSRRKITDPRKMIEKIHREVIVEGAKLFDREYREFITRAGFLKLLQKIQDSDFTLKQIKNGCSTLFDKEFMKIKYTNPHLTNEEIKNQLNEYLDTTKPDRYWDDLEKSQAYITNYSQINKSALSNTAPMNDSVQYGSTTDIITQNFDLNNSQKTVQSQLARHSGLSSTEQRRNHKRNIRMSTMETFDYNVQQILHDKKYDLSKDLVQQVKTDATVKKALTKRTFTLPKFENKTAQASPRSSVCPSKMQTTTHKQQEQQFNTINVQSNTLQDSVGSVGLSTFRGRPSHRVQKNTLFQSPKPHPISKVDRLKASQAEKFLALPISPAFVNNYSVAKPPKLKPIVEFCSQKNIPFIQEEIRYYKINQAKQMHKDFTKTMNQFFETNRPSQIETGLNLLTNEKTYHRDQTGYVNEEYADTRFIYMPPVAQEMLKNIKSEKQRQIELNQMKSKRNVFASQDACDLSSIFSSGKRKSLLKGNVVLSKDQLNDSYKELAFKFEQKKAATLKKLSHNLGNPYSGNDGSLEVNELGQIVQAKNLKKKIRKNDPIKKIFQTNQKVCKFKKVENKKLLRILERIELDKPILMHDKLDIIWDKETDTDQPFNQYIVKTELERLKLQRQVGNKKQIKAYNRMLQIIDQRQIVFHSGIKRPEKIQMHEKEREFFDCIRLIIQNGYELNEADMKDILNFIQMGELMFFEQKEQKTVLKFLKDSVQVFGFNPEMVDQIYEQILQSQGSIENFEYRNNSGFAQNSILEQDMMSEQKLPGISRNNNNYFLSQTDQSVMVEPKKLFQTTASEDGMD